MAASSAICLAGDDNVGIVTSNVQPGTELRLGDRHLPVKDPIPFGHKIALVPIEKGEDVIKFGVPIGRATAAVEAGEHVHIHNIESAYINNAIDHYDVSTVDNAGDDR